MASITVAKDCLTLCFQKKQPVLIWGKHGVGKSQMVRQLADKLYPIKEEQIKVGIRNFIDIRLGNLEVGDLKGLPLIDLIKEVKRMVWALPAFWPTKDDSSEGVIFFDEINRAQSSVLQAIFQITLDRRMDDYIVPDGWHIVAAANPPTHLYQVNELDSALLSRFLQINLIPTKDEWVNFQKAKLLRDKSETGFLNVNMSSIIEFVETNTGGKGQTILDPENEENNWIMKVEPDRRAVEKFGTLIADLNASRGSDAIIIRTVGQGMLGNEITTALMTHLTSLEKPLTGKQVLKEYPKFRKKFRQYSKAADVKMGVIKASVNNVVDYVEKELNNNPNFISDSFKPSEKKNKNSVSLEDDGNYVISDMLNNYIEFLKDCPKEIAMSTLKSGFITRATESEHSEEMFYVMQYVFSNVDFDEEVNKSITQVLDGDEDFLSKKS